MDVGPLTVEFDLDMCFYWWQDGPWCWFRCRVAYPARTFFENLRWKTRLTCVYETVYLADLIHVASGEVVEDVEVNKDWGVWRVNAEDSIDMPSYRAARAYVDQHYVNITRGD